MLAIPYVIYICDHKRPLLSSQVAMSEDQNVKAESFVTEKVDPQSFSQSYLTFSKNIDESEVLSYNVATIGDQKVIQSLSFIHSLSDDMLFEIFLIFVVQSNSAKALRSNPPAQFILSTICRRWRDVVISSPLLWTDIFFPAHPKYDTLIFFERSCPAPINVNFDSVSCRLQDDAALSRFAQALTKHISRLRAFTIFVPGITDMREFWGTLERLEALDLQTLDIRSCYQSTCDVIAGASHTPLWRGGLVRSVRVVGLCFRCLPLLVGLTKLEIGHVELNSRDLQTLLNNYPSLSTLVIGRFGAPNHDFWAPLPDQTPHPAPVLAPSLRSLAIYIDDSHLPECTCVLPWIVMDKLEYLEIMFPLNQFTAHHASILSRVPLLRKLRIYGLVGHFVLSDKSLLFSSLPKSVELEFVYYPESNSSALSEILSLSNLHSITFDLTSRHSSQLGRLLGLDDFVWAVSSTQLKSPIIVHLPITENTVELDAIKAVHGDKLSIHTFPTQEGLLDDFLAPHFGVIDFAFEDGDEPESLEDEIEEEIADELEYEFDDELEDETERSEFRYGPQGLYPSDWDDNGDDYDGDSEGLSAEGFD